MDGASLFSLVFPRFTELPHLPTALGITDEVEKFGLKGTKKKKGRKLDEDFVVCSFATFFESVCNVFPLISRTSNP